MKSILIDDEVNRKYGGIMDKNHNEVNKFWVNFRSVVIEQGINEKNADWYVKWGQKFAMSIKGKPLYKRSLDDVKTFIAKLKGQRNIQEWKVKQAREALYRFCIWQYNCQER